MLEDHHNEPYQAPPQPKLKPFSGVGRLLGNPTPKVFTSTPAPPPSSSDALPPCPKVDGSKPSTQLQVRMPDGSRYVSWRRILSQFFMAFKVLSDLAHPKLVGIF